MLLRIIICILCGEILPYLYNDQMKNLLDHGPPSFMTTEQDAVAVSITFGKAAGPRETD